MMTIGFLLPENFSPPGLFFVSIPTIHRASTPHPRQGWPRGGWGWMGGGWGVEASFRTHTHEDSYNVQYNKTKVDH